MSILNKYDTKINQRRLQYNQKKYNNVRYHFQYRMLAVLKQTLVGLYEGNLIDGIVWTSEWQRRNTWALPVSLESWADIQNLLSELSRAYRNSKQEKELQRSWLKRKADGSCCFSVWRKTCKSTPHLALSTKVTGLLEFQLFSKC